MCNIAACLETLLSQGFLRIAQTPAPLKRSTHLKTPASNSPVLGRAHRTSRAPRKFVLMNRKTINSNRLTRPSKLRQVAFEPLIGDQYMADDRDRRGSKTPPTVPF